MDSLIDLLIHIKDIFFFPGNFLEGLFIGLSNISPSSPASEVKAFLLKLFVKVFFFGGVTIWMTSMLFWSILVFSISKLFIFPRIKEFVGVFLYVCMLIVSMIAVVVGIYTYLHGGGGTVAPVASTESCPHLTTYRNIITSSSLNNITISGTDSIGASRTGSKYVSA